MRYLQAAIVIIFTLSGCTSGASVSTVDFTPATPESPYADTSPVAVIGDSFTSGTVVGGRGPHSWPELVEVKLRGEGLKTNMVVAGGSGYVNPATVSDGVFIDHVARVVNPLDKVVVLFGSSDDSQALPDQLNVAVTKTLNTAIMAAPDAALIVIGPVWTSADPPSGVLRVRDIVRDRAIQVGAEWVDPIAEQWFVNRPDLIGPNGTHPTDAGHKYMAEMIAPSIAAKLRGNT